MSHNIWYNNLVNSLKQLKTQFLEYTEIEKGRALKTVENYDHYLTRFLGFIKNDNPANITDASVREFRLWLNRQSASQGKGSTETLSKKTQNYYLIALRAFLKYLARENIKSLAPERIELAKVGERSLDLITREELARLLKSPNGKELTDLRDKAVLELLFSTGLRVSELCSLTSDINLNSEELSNEMIALTKEIEESNRSISDKIIMVETLKMLLIRFQLSGSVWVVSFWLMCWERK